MSFNENQMGIIASQFVEQLEPVMIEIYGEIQLKAINNQLLKINTPKARSHAKSMNLKAKEFVKDLIQEN